jgi:asparaginyl-tRNA synthetase
MGLEKIYTISPCFRAEKSKTARHLTEYWHAEVEISWGGLDPLTKIAEELISHICQRVAKDCEEELKFLGRDPKDLKKIKSPFPKITYTQALEKLKKKGVKVTWGKDLRTVEEKALGKMYDKPIIVTHYPKQVMAFYKPADPKDPKVSLCFDMIAPEIGFELMGGSERDQDIKAMKKALKQQGEDLKSYEWYFDTRRYGSIPHAGFGMGVDRVVQWICKLKSIKDAIAFPRTPERTEP